MIRIRSFFISRALLFDSVSMSNGREALKLLRMSNIKLLFLSYAVEFSIKGWKIRL